MSNYSYQYIIYVIYTPITCGMISRLELFTVIEIEPVVMERLLRDLALSEPAEALSNVQISMMVGSSAQAQPTLRLFCLDALRS